MWKTITINLHSWQYFCKVMRRLIHTWLHPDSKGSVHLTCITTPLKWKSPSREGRIQFNHTLWKAMSTSLALQIRSTSRCRTYFISWERYEKTASGNRISLSHFWTAKITSPLRFKTTHAVYFLTYCTHIISLMYLKKFTVVSTTSITIWLRDDPCSSDLKWSWSEGGHVGIQIVGVWYFVFLPKVRWEDQNCTHLSVNYEAGAWSQLA